MDAKKNNPMKLDNAKLPLLLVLFVLFLFFLATYWIASSQNNTKDLRRMEGEQLKEELRLLELEAERLTQLEAIVGQDQYVEQLARDELGMVQEDEIVFREVQ